MLSSFRKYKYLKELQDAVRCFENIMHDPATAMIVEAFARDEQRMIAKLIEMGATEEQITNAITKGKQLARKDLQAGGD